MNRRNFLKFSSVSVMSCMGLSSLSFGKDDEMKIVKKGSSIYKYDKYGNLVYLKYPNGEESWHKYDNRNNRIYYKYKKMKFEHWLKYDDRNDCIYSINSSGTKTWCKYNNNHKKISTRMHSKGRIVEVEYDEKGRLFYQK